ncbi:hypothetical protein BDY21DRAFT_358393 [Lineolata rhizophorae]|uniref:Uncharacterized protein n=1 Tax=Lineolata rhizophorae TaxID=578093 RepID=A0A6A6NLW6_9PEZI|nr:hypothetical protein BDY21DRAFT_358393 [Lineolata rhizophorae]
MLCMARLGATHPSTRPGVWAPLGRLLSHFGYGLGGVGRLQPGRDEVFRGCTNVCTGIGGLRSWKAAGDYVTSEARPLRSSVSSKIQLRICGRSMLARVYFCVAAGWCDRLCGNTWGVVTTMMMIIIFVCVFRTGTCKREHVKGTYLFTTVMPRADVHEARSNVRAGSSF